MSDQGGGSAAPVDITVIGAGPTGLFAAFYAGLRDAKVRIIDALPELGGQLTALYPEKYIYDVAGFPKVLAKDLVKYQAEQALQFDPAVHLDERVEALEPCDSGRGYTVVTGKGRYRTGAVLIAAGLGAFQPRILKAPGVAEHEGRGVRYAPRPLDSYAGQNVVIVGGGDSAVDWVLALKDRARSVTLVHRRDGFRAHQASLKLMMEAVNAGQVRLLTFHEVKAVTGNDSAEEIVVYDNRVKDGGREEVIKVDEVLFMLGYIANLGPIADWRLDLEKGTIKVDTTMATNLPGVYAAGDIVTYPGKLKLIATGYGEAAIAANHAFVYAHPEAKVSPGHSSETQR